ncbi:membrane protein [Burkholderia territorii]|nr:membrane protein [Burkholderia territorii]
MTIDATRANYIDHYVPELLDTFVIDAPRRGIAIGLRRPNPPFRPATRHWEAGRRSRKMLRWNLKDSGGRVTDWRLTFTYVNNMRTHPSVCP